MDVPIQNQHRRAKSLSPSSVKRKKKGKARIIGGEKLKGAKYSK